MNETARTIRADTKPLLTEKFDILLITALFVGVFAAWLYTGNDAVKDFARDFVIVIFALLGIRRAAAGFDPPRDSIVSIETDPPAHDSRTE